MDMFSHGVTGSAGQLAMMDLTGLSAGGAGGMPPVAAGGAGNVGAVQGQGSADFASHMNVASVRPTPAGEFNGGGLDLLGIRGQREAVMRELEGISSRAGASSDVKIQELEKTFTDLFNLQLQVQDMSLRAEMASKLAEHATGSTKTVLQTQT
ncbi:MAG: hypothetical protein L6Q35_04190 [Phycisphaerales bacterium]|nr:hypothetical protein [Phycisphaerales bacterium]